MRGGSQATPKEEVTKVDGSSSADKSTSGRINARAQIHIQDISAVLATTRTLEADIQALLDKLRAHNPAGESSFNEEKFVSSISEKHPRYFSELHSSGDLYKIQELTIYPGNIEKYLQKNIFSLMRKVGYFGAAIESFGLKELELLEVDLGEIDSKNFIWAFKCNAFENLETLVFKGIDFHGYRYSSFYPEVLKAVFDSQTRLKHIEIRLHQNNAEVLNVITKALKENKLKTLEKLTIDFPNPESEEFLAVMTAWNDRLVALKKDYTELNETYVQDKARMQ